MLILRFINVLLGTTFTGSNKEQPNSTLMGSLQNLHDFVVYIFTFSVILSSAYGLAGMSTTLGLQRLPASIRVRLMLAWTFNDSAKISMIGSGIND